MANLNRRLRAAASQGDRLPTLEFLDMPVEETAADTVRATTLLCAAGVRGIAVLGGDGTHRLVARDCGDVPLLALSTGTNNAFPEMREATVAGLALGLVATGQVAAPVAHRRNSALAVSRDADRWHGYALVDVGVSADRFAGAAEVAQRRQGERAAQVGRAVAGCDAAQVAPGGAAAAQVQGRVADADG